MDPKFKLANDLVNGIASNAVSMYATYLYTFDEFTFGHFFQPIANLHLPRSLQITGDITWKCIS